MARLADDSIKILSTHSLTFVPSEVDCVLGVELDESGRTLVRKFPTAVEAGDKLRRALGVRFSDYYNLTDSNVVVEGPSDRELLDWYLSQVPSDVAPLPELRRAQVREFGGVRDLGGWLRATYALVRDERALVVLFDGDQAVEKERRELQHFFGQKEVPFQANRE